jgi:uncharacterized OB-fold protein
MDDGLAAAPVFEVEGSQVRLLGSKCVACGAVAFPRRAICMPCGGETVDARLSGRGRVHSWTLIDTPPWGFDESLGYLCVDLDEGPRLLAPAASPAALEIDAGVQAVPGTVKHGHEGFRFEVSADA